jgi:hypothetical protein
MHTEFHAYLKLITFTVSADSSEIENISDSDYNKFEKNLCHLPLPSTLILDIVSKVLCHLFYDKTSSGSISHVDLFLSDSH